MNESDRIYTEIYTKAIDAGATERKAFSAAPDGVYRHKLGQYESVDELISKKVKEAAE